MTTKEINDRAELIRKEWRKRKEEEAQRKAEHERKVKESAELCANDVVDIFAFIVKHAEIAQDLKRIKIVIKIDTVKAYVDIDPKNEKVYEYQPARELSQRVNLEVLNRLKEEYFGEESQIKLYIRKNVKEWMQCWDVVAEFAMVI